MKRLTINHIAGAGIRRNGRAYVSLAVGIFLSLFLVTSLCVLAQGILTARDERADTAYGSQDAFYLDGPATDEEILSTGFFEREIGHAYVTARVQDTDIYMGHLDPLAQEMLNRVCTEGRVPDKAGEIAVEQSALEKMRLTLGVGDSITLPLLPVGGVDEERSYTIVGILTEQTDRLDAEGYYNVGDRISHWPAIVTAGEESFATGRVVQHRLMTFRPGVTAMQALRYNDNQWKKPEEYVFHDGFFAVMMDDGSFSDFFNGTTVIGNDPDTLLIICLVALIGGSLLLGACVGIAGAMEGQLARKTEEIGMLRAVGATQRQIRRIFGREAWLLAAVLAPVSVAGGCLFVWIVSRMLPDRVAFRPTLPVLLPILLLGAAVIVLSSGLPLRRASRIMPMSVMRDTALLRKTKGLRSRSEFRVPRLLARRELRLHPGRQAGAAILTALMLTVISLATLTLTFQDLIYTTEEIADYTLSPQYSGWSSTHFAEESVYTTLQSEDVRQLESLPLVERVELEGGGMVNLVIEESTPWLQHTPYGNRAHLKQPGDPDYSESSQDFWQDIHNEARQALGVEKLLAPIDLRIMTLDPDDLPAALTEGEVDMDAINAGREVLAYAPTYYYYVEDQGENGVYTNVDTRDRGIDYTEIIPQDFFAVGMELDILQLWYCGPAPTDAESQWDYDAMERFDTAVTVGGILTGNGDMGSMDGAIITTHEGARALGLHTNRMSAYIYLSASPDEQSEEALTRRIESIAMRGDMNVFNRMERMREIRRDYLVTTLVFAAVAIVLFAVIVGMVAGAVTRRIRSDVRTIGTLRAVGADLRTLCGCYDGAAWVSLGLGWAGAILLVGVMIPLLPNLFQQSSLGYWILPVIFLCQAVFVAGCRAVCRLLTRLRVAEIMRHSIVENIREL